jgi:nucleoside-diphosphate-sugar epimerase
VRVVITGVGGFVGSWMASYLSSRGHDIIAVYRNHISEETRSIPGICLVQGDLAESLSLPASFDAVVHCAADIPGLCPDETRLTRSNFFGAERLFALASDAGAEVVVSLSSMSVYGTISVPVVTEDLAPDHPDAYGRSKLAAEGVLDVMCGDEKIKSGLSIRLPGTVGRGSHHNFLSGALEKVMTGVAIKANNPDAPFNNIVFVGHLCAFIEQWITRAPAGHAVTNLAAKNPLPIGEVLRLLYQFAGKPEQITWTDEGKPPFLIDLARAESLKYEPATVRDSLEAFVRDCASVSSGAVQS